MAYTIEEHQHRLAAWAAGRAASVRGWRFTVRQAKAILEAAKFNTDFATPSALPKPTHIDATHRKWRADIINVAAKHELAFTHGVAAKLINIGMGVPLFGELLYDACQLIPGGKASPFAIFAQKRQTFVAVAFDPMRS